MLRQHIEPAGAKDVLVELAGQHGIARRQGFEIFEAVARHDQRMARLIHAVVGAAGTLQKPRCALRGSHLDDEIDITPIDTEIEAGCCHNGAQPARRHRRLDLLPRFGREAAVMDADRQRLVILGPQVAEDHLGDGAGVDEHDREPRLFDAPHDRLCRPAAIVAGPGDAVFGGDDLHHRCGAGIAHHQIDRPGIGIGRQPAPIAFRIGNRRRQADAAQPGRKPVQPRQGKAQLITALGRRKGMDLIDDDGPHAGQHRSGIGVGNQQRQ